MDFLSACAEVQSDYLMTVRATSEPNRYGKINSPGLSSFFPRNELHAFVLPC